jgi:hypothetical protein
MARAGLSQTMRLSVGCTARAARRGLVGEGWSGWTHYRENQSQATIAGELRPIIENVLNKLDRWLSVPGAQNRGNWPS